MSQITDLSSEVSTFARDAAYVVVGLGVLGFQKAQVRRVELTNRLATDLDLENRLEDVRKVIHSGVQRVDGIVEGAVQFVETSIEPLEAQLPGPTRDLAKKAHAQARVMHNQIRELVGAVA